MLVDVLLSTGNDENENGVVRTGTDSDGVSVKFCVFCVCIDPFCVCVFEVVVCRSIFSGCVCPFVFAVGLVGAGSKDMCNGCVSSIDTSGHEPHLCMESFSKCRI